MIASAALYYHRQKTNCAEIWPNNLEVLTGYTKSQIIELVSQIKTCVEQQKSDSHKPVLRQNSCITNGVKTKNETLFEDNNDKNEEKHPAERKLEKAKSLELGQAKRPLSVYELYMNC